jgi:hypothetical protein
MKIILSRKGFDSVYGGCPSPILPSGEMVSLPIPSEDSIRYSDIKVGETTYFALMKELRQRIRCKGERIDLNKETKCHLDPDIHKNSLTRECGWRPCFGQIDSAQSHLEKKHVTKNDLFLFFGWFRKTRMHNGKLEFDAREKGHHAIFGYLQIGEIKKVNHAFNIPKWMAYHPHTNEKGKSNKTNTIYIAKDTLDFRGLNSYLPGAGRFKFNNNLILTKNGLSRSKWDLPNCFKKVDISYHNEDSWKDGYIRFLRDKL